MNKLNLIVGLTLLLSISNIKGQLSGGGDLNPDLSAPVEAQEKWMDLRVGLSVHWGPSSLGGEEISWARHSKIKKEVYDNFYKDFNPVKFDANEWVRLMKRWGIKYLSPTAKHHDGFALWFSKFSKYDMKRAKLKVDIMGELAKACKKNDIMLGAYYSNLDWYHPDWSPYQYGGPGPLYKIKKDSPNLDRYFKFMENQCKELINKYDVEFLQFDGEWDATYTHEVGSKFYRTFHKENPNILLSSRIDIGRRSAGKNNHLHMDGLKYAGDFQDRERVVNHGNNVISWLDHPWQAWVTIDKTQWSYNKNPVLLSSDELVLDLVSVVGNNGNYMINLGPRPDGSFEKEQIALMDTLGIWLKKHAKAIYGTRGGPFYPFAQGVSTRKGNNAWLFITDTSIQKLKLSKLSQKLRSAKVFDSGQEVDVTVGKETLLFDLAKVKNEGPVRVIELTFEEKVEMETLEKIAKHSYEEGVERLTNKISYKASSRDFNWNVLENEQYLFADKKVEDFSFHTKKELNPNIIIDLNGEKDVHELIIENRKTCCKERAENLIVWFSNDGKTWEKYWQAKFSKEKWILPITSKHMGASIVGKKIKFIKIGLTGKEKQILHLSNVSIFGK